MNIVDLDHSRKRTCIRDINEGTEKEVVTTEIMQHIPDIVMSIEGVKTWILWKSFREEIEQNKMTLQSKEMEGFGYQEKSIRTMGTLLR